MEGNVPEGVDDQGQEGVREVETVDDDGGKDFLHVVHESSIEPDETGQDEEEGRVDAGLLPERSGGLVLPNDVEIRFQAAEGEDERDEKARCADYPEFADGDVFRVFDECHNGLGGPVQAEHIQQVGQVVRDEVSEPGGERNRGQEDEQRDDGENGCIGEGCCTGKTVVVEERLSGDDSNFNKIG